MPVIHRPEHHSPFSDGRGVLTALQMRHRPEELCIARHPLRSFAPAEYCELIGRSHDRSPVPLIDGRMLHAAHSMM